MSLYYEAQTEDTDHVVTLWETTPGTVVVPDSHLLFNAEFFRVGPDLYLVHDGAARFMVPGYFGRADPADLQDDAGALLRGHLVERLAGPVAPGQYAQAGDPALVALPIGQVETLQGEVTVQRFDGTVETLDVGGQIYGNDVLSTAQGGSVSVTFEDGTVFTLAASSRMVIDELIYDPDATDNSGSFSLIQGSFVFIAGQVAKTGGMDVSTPSSTMGIRGTTVIVRLETVDGVDVTEVSLTTDPDGSRGQFELLDNDGNLLALITDTDTKWIVSGASGESREVERSLLDDVEDNLLIAEAFAAFNSAAARTEAGELPTAPRSGPRAPGPTTDPQDPGDPATDGTDNGLDIRPAPAPPVEAPEPETEPEDSLEQVEVLPQSLDPVPTITITGLEDAGEAEAIFGDITGIGGGPGAVFALLSQPGNGSLTLSSLGGVSYTPDPDFNGVDGFDVLITGANGQTTVGRVVLQVQPVNDAPVAAENSVTMLEDTVLLGNVLASDVDGDALRFAVNDLPRNGQVTLAPDGSYTYQPDPDFDGSDSFSVVVSDPSGASAPATVTISVTAVNDAPVITSVVSDRRASVVEGPAPDPVGGQLSAVDPENQGAVVWSGTSMALFGTFAITAAGVWTYRLDATAADSIGEGESVIESFIAVATDTGGAATTELVEVTITGTNDAPVVAANTVFETMRNGALDGQLIASDADSDGALTFAEAGAPQNGTVVIAADGSFRYTPEPGFVGVDRFSYTVVDAQGAVSTSQVTLAVELAGTGTGADSVSIALNDAATSDAAANTIDIAFGASAAPVENLFIAIDNSVSATAADWAAQRVAVAEALRDLGARMEGNAVDVQVAAFSNRVITTDVFDLQDPELADAILTLPFRANPSRWDRVFNEAGEFFAGQPSGEENQMIFITGGGAASRVWRSALADLTGQAETSFDLTIQVIGVGNGVDPAVLREIDPTPTLLGTGADLADAVSGIVPRLLSLNVELVADGVSQGSVADLNDAVLTGDGLDYQLSLASVENIARLLGAENRITVSAQVDLDGDSTTVETELLTTDVLGKHAAAQLTTGQDGADLLFGSDLADSISGGAGDDVILGFDGGDILDGGAGDDVVLAGAGDDILRVAEVGRDVLDGGAGRDVLKVEIAGDLNAELIPTLELRDIEAIDMANDQANSLRITLADVVDLSSESDAALEELLDAALPESAVIYGDTVDSLTLVNTGDGAFQKVSEQPVQDGNGTTLDIYAYIEGGNVLATLGVDTDIEVTVPVPVA
ncbi:Ig-like domain-containing protein [uncultured Roseobacter sp.]|uniref:Ig-like domain-containing protein n=1 Tax=uncultured Roseobacter sp. TaxID=114847 RepID=UPI00260779B9|nr:Ig-like domain-containing protein [uncultured Roseobacter sp.]